MKRSRAGFSLVEVLVAMTAFAGLGMILVMTLKAAADSQRAIVLRAEEHRIVRRASRTLMDELGYASEDSIVFALAAGQGAQASPTYLSFRQRIELDGAAALGVVHMGEAHEDWSLVYAVEEPVGDGDMRRLVRRVVDETGAIVASEPLARGLRPDGASPPGFSVARSGVLWRVTLTTEGKGNADGVEEVFDVRARN